MKNKYELVTLHRVRNVSADERGDDRGTIGYYTTASAADHAAAVAQGAPYTGVREVPGLRVGDEYFHLHCAEPVAVNVPVEEHEAKATRARAMSKLTEAEKIALGLA